MGATPFYYWASRNFGATPPYPRGSPHPRIIPMLPDPIAEAARLTEADILAFEARMREVIPAYRLGDRVKLQG